MKTISVSASVNYNILIGSNLLEQLGTFVSEIKPDCTAAIISDSNVWPIYGSYVEDSLHRAGVFTKSFVFPAGEESKTIKTYLDFINFLVNNQFCRTDVIIALGGGVVGDIAGFAAATYLRGISYVQVPTSLLAMVDSSVGGKTGIDLPEGKNLLGAFKQPSLVICDVDTLHTLPRQHYLDGCAEVIKYGMLYDAALMDYLMECGPEFDAEYVIGKCVTYKRDVIQADEFDTGCRQLLNFGHTIGHGIEAGSNYSLSHGKCVAIGMAIVTRAAVLNGLCTSDTAQKLISVLERFTLPIITVLEINDLLNWILRDKKRNGARINLIVPRCVGKCEVLPIAIKDLEFFIKAGL